MGKQSSTVSPHRTLRVSSACLLCALTFAAGLLFGTMLTGTAPVKAPSSQNEAPAQNQAAAQSDKLAHALDLEQQVRKNPNDVEALIHLGNVYYDIDKYQDAINAYEKALALQPGNADVLTDLGTMYRALKQFDLALQRYNTAILADPKHMNARFNKGILLLDMGRKEEAKAAWQALVAINPNATAADGVSIRTKIQQLEAQ